MPRPTRVTIDLSALRSNFSVARRHAASARVMAVLKANAYGHGLDRVLPAFADADGIALVELDDAIRLRQSGCDQRILLLGGFYDPADTEAFARYRLAAVIHDEEQVRMLERAKIAASIDVFLKVNSGMNRLGFAPERFGSVAETLLRSGKVAALTAMTHFATADDARGVDWQLRAFARALDGRALPRSMANSAALLRYPDTRGEWVRPGIMLYGSSPFADTPAARLGLLPAMTLASRIVAVQQLAAGDRVGYGGTFTAPRPMRIGVVACGYGDGYPRHAPSGTPVLVDGVRTGTVGLVSMDLICVDLDALPGAGIGSPVTLWGNGLPAEDVAAAAGTVSYELFCGVTARVAVTVSEAAPRAADRV
ncbi:MAG TPA: alanine racemase [Burkholderiales bacterium]|nr:alanine racemase [Burkholderiales bacterium]